MLARTYRRAGAGWALVTALAFARSAGAQTDGAAAEALFRDGLRLMGSKDYPQACPKLAESYRLDPATGTLLALAQCHEAQGKIASAWAEYNDVAPRARRDVRPDREQAARERAQSLESKLSRLTVAVAPGVEKIAGLEIKRDGVLVGPGGWGTDIPVDPGEHVVEASAPGRKPWRGRVSIGAPADRQSVLVPMLGEAPAAQAGADKAGVSPAAGPEAGGSPLRTVGIVVGAAGVVGLAVGTVFGLQAISKNNQSNSSGCVGNACPPDAKQQRLDARSAGNISTVGFVAGGVLLVGGVTLFLAAPKGRSTEVQAGAVGPTGAPGLLLSGRF